MAKKRGQNEGSIRERFKKGEDGKKIHIGWEARYTVGKTSDGKQKQKTIYGKTPKEVKKSCARF